MTTLLTILGITSAITSFMVWVEFRAPQGYEDETGFHYGEEPRPAQ